MPPTSPPEWKLLPVVRTDRGHLPQKILYRFTDTSDGFSLHVTDLIHIWEAAATTNNELIEQASSARSSIDPSEDASQLAVLISKLKAALSGTNDAKCRIGKRKGGDIGAFRLVTKTPLPSPLEPLLWTFEMRQAEAIVFTRELMLPALLDVVRREKQLADLKRVISEKDHIIMRLMDKMEQSSTDLSMVFPGFSGGRKGLNAQQASKTVPGIARLDLAKWQEEFEDVNQPTAQGAVSCLREFDRDGLSYDYSRGFYKTSIGPKRPVETGNWDQNWPDEDFSSKDFTDDDAPKQSEDLSMPMEESLEAFESQGMRPITRLRGETKEENDQYQPIPDKLHSSSSSSPDNSPPATRKTQASKPGTLNRSRPKSKATKSSPPPNRHKSDASTSSSSNSDADSRPTSPPKPQQSKSSKLGRLGGKRQPPRAPSSPPAAAAAAALPSSGADRPPSAPRSTTPSRKVGVLGGRKPAPSSHHLDPPIHNHQFDTQRDRNGPEGKDIDPDETPSLSPSPPSTRTRMKESAPRSPEQKSKPDPDPDPDTETAAEKANRKREELKRTLDPGGGAGRSGKKKRKF